jgi:hypothetical protein
MKVPAGAAAGASTLLMVIRGMNMLACCVAAVALSLPMKHYRSHIGAVESKHFTMSMTH